MRGESEDSVKLGVCPCAWKEGMQFDFLADRLETRSISGHARFGKTVYLPARGFWKTTSPTPYTGPGRLQVAGRRGSTVMGRSEASKRLAADVRPGVIEEVAYVPMSPSLTNSLFPLLKTEYCPKFPSTIE